MGGRAKQALVQRSASGQVQGTRLAFAARLRRMTGPRLAVSVNGALVIQAGIARFKRSGVLWAEQFGCDASCSGDFGPDFFQDAPSMLKR